MENLKTVYRCKEELELEITVKPGQKINHEMWSNLSEEEQTKFQAIEEEQLPVSEEADVVNSGQQ